MVPNNLSNDLYQLAGLMLDYSNNFWMINEKHTVFDGRPTLVRKSPNQYNGYSFDEFLYLFIQYYPKLVEIQNRKVTATTRDRQQLETIRQLIKDVLFSHYGRRSVDDRVLNSFADQFSVDRSEMEFLRDH